MNIALVMPHVFDKDAGGVQRSTYKLAQIFNSNSKKAIVLSLSPKQEDGIFNRIHVFSITNNKIIDYEKIKRINNEYNIQILINQAGFDIKLTKQLCKLKKKFSINIVNTLRINPLNFIDNNEFFIKEFLNSKGLSFLNSKLLRSLIITYHKLKQSYELNYIISNVEAFVMLSERFKPELYELSPNLKKYNSKIHAINNPFPIPNVEFENLSKVNAILYVGRLEIIQKRTDLLLEIWKQLHQELADWEFWILGEGPHKSDMIEFCNKNNMNRVKFFGQKDPDPFYRQAKIFHMTSAFEGFGNVLVEAQSYACVPIMFNSYSAAQDIVLDDETGLLIKPFEVQSYIDKTLKLIEDKKDITRLGKNAIPHSKNFSYEKTYRKWEDLFNSFY